MERVRFHRCAKDVGALTAEPKKKLRANAAEQLALLFA